MAKKPTYEELEKRVQELENTASGQKLVEEKLYEKMHFSQTLLQAAPVFFVAINAQGKTIIANETMLDSLGYKQEEIVGKDYLTTFVPEKNREELSKIFYKLIRLNKPTLNENYILTKDGKEILIEWHGRSIFNKKNEFLYFIGLGIDVTERRQAEKELKREREALSMILESTPHGIALVDHGDNYRYLNPYYTKITGYTLEDIPSKEKWFEKAYPDENSRKKAIEAWNKDKNIRSDKVGKHREFKIKCKNGDTKHIEFRTSFQKNQMITVLTDVTLRKESEEMVRDKDRLQGALELSGAVCHEMTQPLMSVLGYFDLMLIDMPVDDLNYSKIGKIQIQLERMSNITKKMMEISRYQTKDYLNGKIIDLAGISISEK